MSRIEEILRFWFGAPGDAGHGERRRIWFEKDPAFDDEVRARFIDDYRRAAAGDLDHWADSARGALALILLLDQFPRNMFRGEAHAYATDARAHEVARRAIDAGLDETLRDVERLFVYLPFEHSENLADQRLSVALRKRILDGPDDGEGMKFARRHLEIIERFGRFPHRNAALGRVSTVEELAFLEEPDSSF